MVQWLFWWNSFTNNFISSMPLENTFLAILHDLCQIWLDTRCKQQGSCLLLSEWPLLDCIDCASFRHRYLSRTNSGIHMWHPSSEMGVESLEESIALLPSTKFWIRSCLDPSFCNEVIFVLIKLAWCHSTLWLYYHCLHWHSCQEHWEASWLCWWQLSELWLIVAWHCSCLLAIMVIADHLSTMYELS